MHALLCVQCFPPLSKNAGGVSKDYLALCRALIDDLGWRVTVLTPVDVAAASDTEPDVRRWLAAGLLEHVGTGGVQGSDGDGIAIFWDVFSIYNMQCLFLALWYGDYAMCIVDDIIFRIVLLLLVRGVGLPSVATTHTDVPRHPSFRKHWSCRLAWYFHLVSAFSATVHATVSHVFADALKHKYRLPVHAVWPPVLWSNAFKRPHAEVCEQASRERSRWIALFGFSPRAIFLYAGRWSQEKRIHLLAEALPERCGLVIVGDSDTEYADGIEALQRRDVLPFRRMLDAEELRIAYAACDMVVSASDFETRGNVLVEALSAGVPVAVQPVQGHLEFVKDGQNSYLVDFADAPAARQRLESIIAGGPSLAVQPGLAELGARMRNLDFAAELRDDVLSPALRAGVAWSERRGWRWFWELLFRGICLVSWFIIWLTTGLSIRVFYMLSRTPRFVYLEPGTATEPVPGKTLSSKTSSQCEFGQALLV